MSDSGDRWVEISSFRGGLRIRLSNRVDIYIFPFNGQFAIANSWNFGIGITDYPVGNLADRVDRAMLKKIQSTQSERNPFKE